MAVKRLSGNISEMGFLSVSLFIAKKEAIKAEERSFGRC